MTKSELELRVEHLRDLSTYLTVIDNHNAQLKFQIEGLQLMKEYKKGNKSEENECSD